MARSKIWMLLAGDHLGLADFHLRRGELLPAAERYARAGQFAEAAKVSIRAGRVPQAVEWLVRGNDPKAAAELLVAEDRHREAVALFEQAGALWAAAEAALHSNQLQRAARFFALAGDDERAADCFERAGDPAAATAALERLKTHKEQAGNAGEVRQIELRRARLLAGLGRKGDAALLLDRLDEPLLAADLHLGANDPAAAAHSFLQAGAPQRALPLLDSQEIDSALRARILSATSSHAEAARLYREAGEWALAADQLVAAGDAGAAAELLEANGDAIRAAELFDSAGLFADAGRCYTAAGGMRAAGEAFHRAGRHREAASSFQAADEPIKAAREWIRIQDHDSAAATLEAVPIQDPRYEDATLLLAPMWLAADRSGELLERLDSLAVPATAGTRDLERSYWRGRALEALGRPEAAREAMAGVVAADPEHRDAKARLAALVETLRGLGSRSSGEGSLVPGQLLEGRYLIEREMGRGGMSRVYSATDRRRGERVALKVLVPRAQDAANAVQRLRNEIEICRRIDHPNIVRVLELGRFEDRLFVTMELLEGVTLDRLLRARGPLPEERVGLVVGEVLQGLAEAHRLRIIHRDLKPGNILVTPARVKIMDFGIAVHQDSDVSLTQSGQVIGSPMYMSPEQIRGQEVDPRSDLYSLGVVIFTLFVGHEPYRGRSPTEISLKHLQEPVPDLAAHRPDLDPGWVELVTRLLQKLPEDRFSSAREVGAALLRVAVRDPIPAAPGSPSTQKL